MSDLIAPTALVSYIPLFLSILSLLLSIAAFYYAYLKGPDIKLKKPPHNNPYPCRGIDTLQWPEHVELQLNLMITNDGNRSGVLFDFHAQKADHGISQYDYNPTPGEELPKVLQPGDEWKTKLTIRIQMEPELIDPGELSLVKNWENYVANRETLTMKTKCVTNNANRRFWRTMSGSYEELPIDFTGMQHDIMKKIENASSS